ncbi:hypothetical protein VTG60DRAFT_1330 [Thermothelomyces hinnuleus]
MPVQTSSYCVVSCERQTELAEYARGARGSPEPPPGFIAQWTSSVLLASGHLGPFRGVLSGRELCANPLSFPALDPSPDGVETAIRSITCCSFSATPPPPSLPTREAPYSARKSGSALPCLCACECCVCV